MPYNNGPSRTSIPLLRSQDNIYEAIRFWSANVCSPRKNDKLDNLGRWLSTEGYSCYEFLIYITNYSIQDLHIESLQSLHAATRKKGISGEHLLIKHNAWAAKQEIINGFTHWKQHREEELQLKYKIILEDFSRRRQNLDIHIILERSFLKAGPVFTIDIACIFREQLGDTPKTLVKNYSPSTMLMLMGCPEYLKICPTLETVIKENVDGLCDLIFSRDW